MNSTYPRARRTLVRIATTAILTVVPMATVSVSALAETPAAPSGIQLDNIDRPGKGRGNNNRPTSPHDHSRQHRDPHDHSRQHRDPHDHSRLHNGRRDRDRDRHDRDRHDRDRRDRDWNRGRHGHHANPPRNLPPAPNLLPPPPPPILLPPLVLPFPLPWTGSAF